MKKTLAFCCGLFVCGGAFAWEYDQVDVVDLDELELLCASWKAAPSAQ